MNKTHRPGRAVLLVFSGLLGILSLAPDFCRAQTASAPASARGAMAPQQAQQTPEGKFIQNLGDQAINVLKDTSLSPAQTDAKFNDLLNSAFDMETIGKFVLGRKWLQITPQQQQEYLKLFKQLVLKNYGNRLRLYHGEGFQVTGVRPQSGQDTSVSTQITHPDGSPPTEIDWVVRHENGGRLAIVDVIMEGVSQSVTQRDEFSSILARNNGNFDALLSALRQNAQQGQEDQPQGQQGQTGNENQ